MGLLSGVMGFLGGGGGPKRIDPFGEGDRKNVINPLQDSITGAFGNFNMNDAMSAIRNPNYLEQSAANTFMGPFGANSFLQGGMGSLGTAGGMFNQAQGMVGGDPFGARPAMGNFLSGGFTDVANDPQTQALLAQQAQGVQGLLNKNMDQIGASAVRAGGGVGSGSGEVAAKTQAVGQAASSLANQQAQTLFGEQARRQGIQLAAAQQAMGEGNRQAQIMGQLGQGLGGMGLGMGQMGGQMLGQQMGLGGTMHDRNMMAQLFPMENMFRLGDLLKSTSGVSTPNAFQNLESLGNAANSAGRAMG